MRRPILALFLSLAAVGAFWFGSAERNPVEAAQGSLAAQIVREPILVYDVSGYTLTGAVHRKLCVYNDGLATAATMTNFQNPDGSATFTVLPVNVVQSLQAQLAFAGAGSNVDNPNLVTDVPIQTVTFFRSPATIAKANTYSYYLPNTQQQAAHNVIQNFMSTHFPGY